MKTKLFDINVKDMRLAVREQLTEKAQYVAEHLHDVISGNINEAYSDNPFATNDKIPYYSRDDVKNMLQKVETPNKNDDNFEDNFNNDVHSSTEGKAKIVNATTNQKDVENNGGSIIKVDTPEYNQKNAVRLMKDLYFKESVDDVTYVDGCDCDDSDEEEFRNALVDAQTTNSVIVIQLDDGNELDLDIQTINKLLSDESMFKKALSNFESLSSITDALDIKISDEDGTHDYDGYMESVDDDVLLDKEYFAENVNEYIDGLMPAALYAIKEDMFKDAHVNALELSRLMEKTRGNNPNRIERGRAVMVNRVRAGQLQLRKVVSDSKGYKVVNGIAVRMKPAEIKKRRIAGRFASKKRRNQQSAINRKTKLSLRFRARRLTD